MTDPIFIITVLIGALAAGLILKWAFSSTGRGQ